VNAPLVDYKHNIMAFENHSIHNIRYVCTKFKKKKQQSSMWIDCLGAWPFGLAGFEVLPFSDIY
jgi:hypothetical protein